MLAMIHAAVYRVIRQNPSQTCLQESVSKAFGGAVALALAADGTLSLCDTVGKWLPFPA
jgi:Beta-lactamase